MQCYICAFQIIISIEIYQSENEVIIGNIYINLNKKKMVLGLGRPPEAKGASLFPFFFRYYIPFSP